MQKKHRFHFMIMLSIIAASTLTVSGAEHASVGKQFHSQLLEVASHYQSYGKVDDLARWAPWLCMMPPPPKAKVSTSTDIKTHGKKIYYLFAKDREAYVKNSGEQIGQIIVKESWMPPVGAKENAKDDSTNDTTVGASQPTEKHDLFIMMKLDPKTAETDDGWVYGTVTADGKKVTSAGRVQSCMSCHTNAQHNRLFGLKH